MTGVIEVLTAVLVIVTAVYSYFTYKMAVRNAEMVEQMKAQQLSFVAPAVNANIRIKHGSVFCLTVKNTGHSAARNLRLSLDRDLHQFSKPDPASNIRNFPMFQETLPSFAPGEELFTMLMQGHEMQNEQLTPNRFTVTVRYDFAGKPFEQQHEINLAAYMRSAQDRDETFLEIEKNSQSGGEDCWGLRSVLAWYCSASSSSIAQRGFTVLHGIVASVAKMQRRQSGKSLAPDTPAPTQLC